MQVTGTASPSHVQVKVCTGLGEYMLRVVAKSENSTIFLVIGTVQVAAVVTFPTMTLYSHCKPGSKCCRRSSQHQSSQHQHQSLNGSTKYTVEDSSEECDAGGDLFDDC